MEILWILVAWTLLVACAAAGVWAGYEQDRRQQISRGKHSKPIEGEPLYMK